MIAIPNIANTYNNHKLSVTAESLYSNLQLARSEAFKRNTIVYVSFVTGSNWCYGINVGSPCDCSNSSSCSLGITSYTDSKQTTLSTSGYSNYISFESSHGSTNASGSLTLTLSSGNLITLSIGRLGSIQMCSNNLSKYDSC